MKFGSQVLTIDGMHCDACVSRVTHALNSVPGVRVSSVKVGKAEIVAEPACEQKVRSALDNLGFSLKEMHAAN